MSYTASVVVRAIELPLAVTVLVILREVYYKQKYSKAGKGKVYAAIQKPLTLWGVFTEFFKAKTKKFCPNIQYED